jgi:hypothetical protein
MFSKRELEGYLEIDHRESPGVNPEDVPVLAGIRMAVPGGTRGQFPAVKCHVCERLIVMNPLRTRDRSWCSKHDAYECDDCAAKRARTGECKPFSQVIDEFLNQAAKKGNVHG